MPCTDGGPSQEQIEARKELIQQYPRIIAMLCSALTYLEDNEYFADFLIERDKKGSGVSNDEITDWWEKHKSEDLLRIEARQRKLDLIAERKQDLLMRVRELQRDITRLDKEGSLLSHQTNKGD